MGLLSRREPAPIVDVEPVELTALSAECEAFLDGALAAMLTARDGESPVWTWLNAIAHGDEAQVRALAATVDTDVPAATARTLASAALADGRDLTQLQRDVLVPLELQIIGEVMTPRRLIEVVARSLYGS